MEPLANGQRICFLDCQGFFRRGYPRVLLELGWFDGTVIFPDPANKGAQFFLRSRQTSLVRQSAAAELPQRILRLTNLTQADLADGAAEEELLIHFCKFLEDTHPAPLFTHYAQFERRCLLDVLTRVGGNDLAMNFNERLVCTYKLAKMKWPRLPSYSLAYLAELLGLAVPKFLRVDSQLSLNQDLTLSLLTLEHPLDSSVVRTKLQSLRTQIAEAPRRPGVYKFLNHDNQVVYVGKSNCLRARLYSHISRRILLDSVSTRSKVGDLKDKLSLVLSTSSISWEERPTDLEAALDEVTEIKRVAPLKNKIYNHRRDRLYWVRAYYPYEVIHVQQEDVYGPFPEAGRAERVSLILKAFAGDKNSLEELLAGRNEEPRQVLYELARKACRSIDRAQQIRQLVSCVVLQELSPQTIRKLTVKQGELVSRHTLATTLAEALEAGATTLIKTEEGPVLWNRDIYDRLAIIHRYSSHSGIVATCQTMVPSEGIRKILE